MKYFKRLNPLISLRVRLGFVVLGAVLILAVFLNNEFGKRLTNSYHQAGRITLNSIAGTWDDGFRGTDLENPDRMQERIELMRANNPALHKISISWHEGPNTLMVADGHEHDPDGVKREISTSEVRQITQGSPRRAPIDENSFDSREVSAVDGAHYVELNYPVKRSGKTIAALELHFDLKNLDAALARDKRTVFIAAILAAFTLAFIVNLLLGRAVLNPLDRLRAATHQIREGATETRLNWKRKDEIGVLARDFDLMAEELQEVHGHLETLALKDPLTGLLNHRAFQERLAAELRRAERERYLVSIVALDVDYFKQLNDRWGHAAGDKALRSLAQAIKGELRPSDICGRVGGDEFVLGIVRSDADDAEQVVERLRETVASMEVGPAGETMTISAGISEFPKHSLAQEELMHLADGAMYWAKSHGRNRTFIYTSENDFALSAQEAAERVTRESLVNTVHALAKAVDAKDGYTHSHSQRVSRYGATLARRLGMSSTAVERIRTAGVLHDVGKIGISDVLLLKPGKLSDEQFAVMQRHSELGRDIIAGAGMDDIATIVLHLHERYDGKGYPDGLARADIPLEARVLHVADALEAMTSSREYRPALPVETAIDQLREHSGTQFDPTVVTAVLELIDSGELEILGDRDPLAEENAAEAAKADDNDILRAVEIDPENPVRDLHTLAATLGGGEDARGDRDAPVENLGPIEMPTVMRRELSAPRVRDFAAAPESGNGDASGGNGEVSMVQPLSPWLDAVNGTNGHGSNGNGSSANGREAEPEPEGMTPKDDPSGASDPAARKV
ncbi:MAG: bifunctional diguanylate cyclase/phosphohydrolase [Solirubrobacterales bacterium]